jgi:hypothetical protein
MLRVTRPKAGACNVSSEIWQEKERLLLLNAKLSLTYCPVSLGMLYWFTD